MKELLPFLRLYRAHWGRLSLGVILALVTLLASIGLLSLSGWFIAASAVAGLVISSSKEFNYMMPAGGVRFLSVARTTARWAERVVSHDATFRLLATLRGTLFARLGPLSRHQTAHLQDADLLNRMVSDVDALDHLYLRLISPLIAAVLVVLIVAALTAQLDVNLGLTLALCLGGLMLALPLGFYRAGRQPGELLGQWTRRYRLALVAHLHGHAELNVFGALGQSRAQLAKMEQELLVQQRTMARLGGLAQALLTTLSGWTMLLMLVVADSQFQQVPSPWYALVVFATLASFEALSPLAGAFQHLGHTRSAAERLNPLMTLQPVNQYGTRRDVEGALALSGLSFRYPGATAPVLRDIDLTLAPGEKIALLGSTGCGKTTLLDLIGRHLVPTAGQITLGDRPLIELSHSALRREICHISQRVHLFNDTLGNNLRLALPEATEAQLRDALERVGLGYLLEQLGLDGWLGEGGRQLSGGEIRRVGLARALLHPAKILLLDEITEGLDPDNEARVLDLLFQHRPERSVLMISHRLTGLERMDRVLRLEQGQLVHEGP